MTGRASTGTAKKHHTGHSRSAQQAIAEARRCDEYNARHAVALTKVRALLVELGQAAHAGARRPIAPFPSAGLVEPVEIGERELAPRQR